MIVGSQSLHLETLLLHVKDGHVFLHGFAAWLLESAGASQVRCTRLILRHRLDSDLLSLLRRIVARAWHAELETLTVEDLIVIEAWRSLVEADVLAREHLVVDSAALASPGRASILEVILGEVCRAQHVVRALERLRVALCMIRHLGRIGRSVCPVWTNTDHLLVHLEAICR